MGERQNDVKRNDGDQQRTEKQPIFFPVSFAVAGDQFKEHVHCHLLTVPLLSKSVHRTPV